MFQVWGFFTFCLWAPLRLCFLSRKAAFVIALSPPGNRFWSSWCFPICLNNACSWSTLCAVYFFCLFIILNSSCTKLYTSLNISRRLQSAMHFFVNDYILLIVRMLSSCFHQLTLQEQAFSYLSTFYYTVFDRIFARLLTVSIMSFPFCMKEVVIREQLLSPLLCRGAHFYNSRCMSSFFKYIFWGGRLSQR